MYRLKYCEVKWKELKLAGERKEKEVVPWESTDTKQQVRKMTGSNQVRIKTGKIQKPDNKNVQYNPLYEGQ